MRQKVFVFACMSGVTLVIGFAREIRLADLPTTTPKRVAQSNDSSGPLRHEVQGGIAFRPEKRVWIRITGKVRVLNSHSLTYEDGTKVDLRGQMDSPDLEQKGLVGGQFYSCGKEAAEFLKRLIGNRSVTCLCPRDQLEGNDMNVASAYVGETNLNTEMVRNGWAISDHEGMDPWEIVAREKKRGLWRGKFVVPKRWRAGERLPGE